MAAEHRCVSEYDQDQQKNYQLSTGQNASPLNPELNKRSLFKPLSLEVVFYAVKAN